MKEKEKLRMSIILDTENGKVKRVKINGEDFYTPEFSMYN